MQTRNQNGTKCSCQESCFSVYCLVYCELLCFGWSDTEQNQ